MLIRRLILAITLGTAMASVSSAGFADVSDGASCDSASKKCTADSSSSTNTDGGTADHSGSSSGGGTERVCQPPTGPGIPTDIDCDGCNYQTLDRRGDEGEYGEPPKNGGLPSPGYKWLVKTCYPGATMTWREVPIEQQVPLIPAHLVALRASATFTLPRAVAQTSPPGTTLVNLPTFLYLDPDGWITRTAHASIPGTTVTVTATPEHVTWATSSSDGDHGTVTCRGPGRPYTAARDDAYLDSGGPEDALRDGRCTTLYRHTTGATPITLTATVSWAVSWTCAGTCDQRGGTLPSLHTTAQTHLTVRQARAELVSPDGA
jgi:hypothetical protein